jgi:electron transfer flavoprotein beta subunit
MRGIMQARTKPLNVVKAIGNEGNQKVISYDTPPEKSSCKFVDPNNIEELVKLLQNEAKVL